MSLNYTPDLLYRSQKKDTPLQTETGSKQEEEEEIGVSVPNQNAVYPSTYFITRVQMDPVQTSWSEGPDLLV